MRQPKMSRKDGITVNGMMLNEFLRDKESIEDEIKSKKLIKDGFEKFVANKHIKAKYPPKKDKNGKVKILGKLEVNMMNFKEDLKRELSAKKVLRCIVIVIVAHSEKRLYTTKEISDILIKFGKEHNINVNPNINWPVRSSLGTIRRSKLGDYIEYHKRDHKRNAAEIGLKSEYKSKFTTKEALEMVEIEQVQRVVNRKTKKEDLQLSEKNENHVINLEETSVTNKVVDELKKISSGDGPLFTIQGDIHIHINILK